LLNESYSWSERPERVLAKDTERVDAQADMTVGHKLMHRNRMPVGPGAMRIRLKRKFAESINGIDLSHVRAGEMLDVSPRDADILVAEGWAERADAAPVRDSAHDRQRRPGKSRGPRKAPKSKS
jgi:hypothetical protein